MSPSRSVLTAAVVWVILGCCSPPVARGQQAMPPSVVIEEENPVNTVPRIMSPQVPRRIVGTAPYVVGAPQFGVAPEASAVGGQPWGWQFLPSELI